MAIITSDEPTGTAEEGKSLDEKDGDMLFHQVCRPWRLSHCAHAHVLSCEMGGRVRRREGDDLRTVDKDEGRTFGVNGGHAISVCFMYVMSSKYFNTNN
jgi:hypothetical protein